MTDGPLRHPFLRRLPLVLLLVAGVFLWRSTVFPQPRTLVWEVPSAADVTRAEVQLWRGTRLVARAEWPSRPRGLLLQRLQLRGGTYRALSFLALADGSSEEHAQEVTLAAEETVSLSLRPR